jgi:hypothetical protein
MLGVDGIRTNFIYTANNACAYIVEDNTHLQLC